MRRVDELGRLVIPKEIRRTMRLAEGTPLEIFTDEEGQIILKNILNDGVSSFAKQYAESVAQTMNQKVAVSDRDQIIAVAGGGKRELLGKTISRQLEEMIINRENSIQAGLDKRQFTDKRRRRQLQCTGHLSDLLRGRLYRCCHFT